ncbi:MAG: hypothetical protein U0401_02320 [Anaerolineae bacterium]
MSIVLTAATMFVWYFLVAPTAAANQGDLLTQIVAAAYPIGGLTVLGGIFAILFRRPDWDTQAALRFFLVGMILFVATDMAFSYTSLAGIYEVGGWIDTGWVIAHALYLGGATSRYILPASTVEPGWLTFTNRFTKILPLMAMGLAHGLTLYVALVDFRGTTILWLFAGAVLLTLLVIYPTGGGAQFANLSLRTKLILAFLTVTVLSVGAITFITNQLVSYSDRAGGKRFKETTHSQAQKNRCCLNKQLELRCNHLR